MSSEPIIKNCPQCQAVLAPDASACVCGHRFGLKPADAPTSADLVSQAETLYESHLRARLQRATRAARLAKTDLLRDPRSTERAAQLRDAEKEIKLLEAQLIVQGARIVAARERAVQPTPAAAAPSLEFSADQAAKAEQAFELLRRHLTNERSRIVPSSAMFSVAQAEKAQNIVQRDATAKTCPQCGHALILGATRCDCGYHLSQDPIAVGSNDSDFLTDEERAALRRNG